MGEESAIRWRRSGRCNGESTCVEIAFVDDRVLVRNSQAPDGPTATFSRAEWAVFVTGVKNDEFEPAQPEPVCGEGEHSPDGDD